MDRFCFVRTVEFMKEFFPTAGIGAALLLEVDGNRPEVVAEEAKIISTIWRQNKAKAEFTASSEIEIERWEEILPQLLKEIYHVTASLGGTISGEHGIGRKRKDYLEVVMDSAQIEVMRRIQQVLDPNNILNPGKIIPS